MDPLELPMIRSRRAFMTSAGSGLGAMALYSLLAGDARANSRDDSPTALPEAGHHQGKAKSVIFIFLAGGPSQLDLFDPKPLLHDFEGQSLPESMTRGKQFAFINPQAGLRASQFRFARHGECGMHFSELVPHLARCADDVAMIRSMQTDSFNHLPGHLLMNTGFRQFGRPSLGAWVLYGLGSESADLPGYVVLTSGSVRGGGANWSNGFLPPLYQGVRLNNQGDPVLNLSSPVGITPHVQRRSLDVLQRLNGWHAEVKQDPEISSRIAAYELAFRMQAAAPELFDVSSESEQTLSSYGVGRELPPDMMASLRESQREAATTFARNCLLARRMVERGVRFVTVFHGDWDHHSRLQQGLANNCTIVDQPVAALIQDLKQRGLLDETLVVISGEFGRTPLAEGEDGRDHHPYAFCSLLAGGGVRGGTTYGKTDDFGFDVVEHPCHINDLHATILHLLGLDHLRLTYRHQGREHRLTDVAGNVIEDILA